MSDIRVRVLADDAVFADALAAYLSAEPALVMVEGPNADVVVIAQPDARAAMAGLADDAAVVVVGPSGVEAMIEVFEAGAVAYLPEGCAFEEIRAAVLAVAEGQAVVPPNMLGSLLRHVVQRRRAARADLERLDTLTQREREVFALLAKGLDRTVIAERLFISVGTVRTHLDRVFKKLDVHTHAEIVAFAARCGIIDSDREETP